MERYTDADEDFYLTATPLLTLARNAYRIFDESEPEEKRQFLNFLFQDAKLNGRNLEFTLKAPFDRVLEANRCNKMLRCLDSNQEPTP